MKNRLLAFLLVVLTLLGATILPVSAAETATPEYETATNAAVANKDADNNPYSSVTKKLSDEIAAGWSELYAQNEKYQLFCNKYTGEVYLRDRTTGQYLTSNPVNIGSGQEDDKLSQVWLSFKSIESGAAKVNYTSFKMAAKKGQISVSRTRGGIRVEYTMGDVTSRYIAPQALLETDYIESVLKPYQDHILGILNYEFLTEHFDSFIDVSDSEAEEVYRRLDQLVAKSDPDEFLRDIGAILGTPSSKYDKRNENVCSRFRYDYLQARDKIKADLKDTNPPEVIAAAQERRDQILKQLALLMPTLEVPTIQTTDLLLPGASTIGEKLNDVYKDFGNFTNSYENVVDLNKYYENGKPKTDAASKAQIELLKKKYGVLNYDLAEGETYPVIRTLSIDSTKSEAAIIRDFQKVQKYFTDCIEDYTLTVMLAQEEKVDFEPLVFDNPLFRCALEYTLDDTGVTVDLPTSSIIFDESKYELTEISFLRYFGAGSTENAQANDGYVFYPDGSGALIYNKTMPSSAVLNQPFYGYDYAYANLGLKDTGDSITSSQPIRLPVFGAVNPVITGYNPDTKKLTFGTEHVGYLAIITEGESLARLYSKKLDDGGTYIGVYPVYTLRATDTYSIGRLSGNTVSISAEFKFNGFFTQKYVMLTDEDLSPDGYGYRADYVGMADAYRDYLTGRGELTALSAGKLKERIPLYLETYATVETDDTILSFPVRVDKPLTSFKDVQTLGNELREAGISNVKFRLIGYYNDGYEGYYPNRVKWMKEAGGKKGFKSLVSYVEEHKDEGFEAFTDVDLLYNYRVGNIGGISRKKTGVRRMDDRYVQKGVYSTIYRSPIGNYGLLISASKLLDLFKKFDKKFSKFKSTAISLANLATDLSSNFNEDDFFTREEAKTLIADMLNNVSEEYTVMSTGGNIYTIPYIDYLLSAPVDGSHYNYVSRTVPFFGMVMHGSLQYAGEVLNEAGNPGYELLRDIESGAGMYVVLVYQNTDLMKDDSKLIKHYSANYQIWHDDLISYYDLLDYAIGDLQTATISDHKFLTAERHAQESEREEDARILEEEYFQLLTKQYEDRLIERNKLLRYLWYLEIPESITKTTRDARIKTLGQAMLTGKTYGEDAMNRIKEVIEAIRGDYPAGTADKDIAPDALKKMIDPTDPFFTYSTDSGQRIKVLIDVDAILADAEEQLNATPSDWLREQVAAFKDASENDDPAGVMEFTVSGVDGYATKTKNSFVTDSEADDPAYKKTSYTIDDGSVVLVTYKNGDQTVRFLLNFSIFTVTVKLDGVDYTLGKYDFVRLDPREDGKTDPRTP